MLAERLYDFFCFYFLRFFGEKILSAKAMAGSFSVTHDPNAITCVSATAAAKSGVLRLIPSLWSGSNNNALLLNF
jgi:hypothetical protein